jgi:hypothetical protein
MAVLVTIVAVGVTYAGTIVVSTVTQEETLPGSTALADAIRPQAQENGGKSAGRMEVTPDALRCTPDCEDPVTIRNTGGTGFVIKEIDVDGADAESFSRDEGCVDVELREGDECEFTVTFDPNDAKGEATATLLVRNDLTENEVTVALTGHTPQPELDLAIAAGDVRCTHEAGDTEGTDGSLSIAFFVTVTGTDDFGEVPVTVSSDTGSSDTTTVFAGEGAEETVLTLPVDGSDSGDHVIKINVDPGNETPESDEGNNDIEAHCTA